MTGIIIQARTGSKRLPGKMIIPFFKGKGILETILIRLKYANLCVPIVLATTDSSLDDIIEDIGFMQEIDVYRGSENNVLKRFIEAGERFKIDKIIRICADNPFLDLISLQKQIKEFNKMDVDYWCYALNDNTPTIKTHYGFWTEGVKLSSLKKVAEQTNDKYYLEHVTNFIYSNPDQFSIHFESIDISIEQEKNIRLTIDTDDDFNLGQKLYSNLNELEMPITATNILAYIKEKPDFLETMKNGIAKNTK